MAATVDVMNTEVLSREGTQLTIQVTVDISGSMLQAEEKILDACNEVGCLATEETLQRFDADGSPIVMGDVKWTAKRFDNKTYRIQNTCCRRFWQISRLRYALDEFRFFHFHPVVVIAFRRAFVVDG